MVCFERPDDSDATLEWLTARAEVVLQRLGLPYRVKLMSTGDMGFTQAKKYDLEVWAPGVERWLEVSSVSIFRDYQARRMNVRWRPEPGAKPEILHTLNGSGLALPRTVAAILEVYQQPDGSLAVPEALRPWLGDKVIEFDRGSFPSQGFLESLGGSTLGSADRTRLPDLTTGQLAVLEFWGTPGEITKVEGTSVSVKNAKAEEKVFAADKAKVHTKGKDASELSDLKVGDKVTVNYTEEAGKNVAHRIAPPDAPKKKDKEKKAEDAK
jgi:hypothetical protein